VSGDYATLGGRQRQQRVRQYATIPGGIGIMLAVQQARLVEDSGTHPRRRRRSFLFSWGVHYRWRERKPNFFGNVLDGYSDFSTISGGKATA